MTIKTNEAKQMMEALKKFKESAGEIANLWESSDDSGVTPFDSILDENYPFKNCFFFTLHDINKWVDEAAEKLEEHC